MQQPQTDINELRAWIDDLRQEYPSICADVDEALDELEGLRAEHDDLKTKFANLLDRCVRR